MIRMNIILKENEDGYEAVGKIVDKFVDKYGYGNILVKLVISYSATEKPDILTELLLYDDDRDEFVCENDWWEGQRYISVVAIDFVENAKVPMNKLLDMYYKGELEECVNE